MKIQRSLIRRGLAAGIVSAFAIFTARALQRRRRGIQFFRSLKVSAVPGDVYQYWTHFENFPTCFTHVSDIRRTGNENEWRWTINTLAGQELSWDTWVTESIPNKSIAWESAAMSTSSLIASSDLAMSMPIIVLLRCLSVSAAADGLSCAGFLAAAAAPASGAGAWAVQDMLQAIAVIRTAERKTDGIR